MQTKYVYRLLILGLLVVILATIIAILVSSKVEAKSGLEVGKCQNVISLVATSHANGGNPHPACVPNKSQAVFKEIPVKKHPLHEQKITVKVPTVISDGGSDGDSSDGDQKPAKECKNKNSGKDGTPSECNAGKGQEKHQ